MKRFGRSKPQQEEADQQNIRVDHEASLQSALNHLRSKPNYLLKAAAGQLAISLANEDNALSMQARIEGDDSYAGITHLLTEKELGRYEEASFVIDAIGDAVSQGFEPKWIGVPYAGFTPNRTYGGING